MTRSNRCHEKRSHNRCKCKCDDCENDCEEMTFVAILTGSQQVPPVNTRATGEATAKLNGNVLKVKGSFMNLESNFNPQIGAHIHLQMAGQNGPVIFPLTVQLRSNSRSGSFKNSFLLNDDQVRALLDRMMYINIHTINYPAGEIRGQLLPKADKYFISTLNGLQEVPTPVSTSGFGTIIYELNGNQLTASGSVDNLSSPIALNIAGGGHIHRAPMGTNGPIVFGLTMMSDMDNMGATINSRNNVFTLTCDQQRLLMNSGLYANIHTQIYPAGEIRGQILKLWN